MSHLGWETGDAQGQKAAGVNRELMGEEGRRVRGRKSRWFYQPVLEEGHRQAASFLSLMFVLSIFYTSLFLVLCRGYYQIPIIVPLFLIPVMRLLIPTEMFLECNSFTLGIIFKW